MSNGFPQVGLVGSTHLHAAANGYGFAQSEIAINLTIRAEQCAAMNLGFANELLATAEFAANLALESLRSPAALAQRGHVFAVRSWLLASSDPVRALGYQESALIDLDEAAATADADSLSVVALTLNRLADVGCEEAATKLGVVMDALPAAEAVTLREVMRDAAAQELATARGE
jgi:hypothetical protein